MRILWVPHAPFRCGRTRAEHLIEVLAKRHQIHALSFNLHQGWESCRYLSDLLRYGSRHNPAGYEEIPLMRVPKAQWLNSFFLNRTIEVEALRKHCDVVVVSPNPYLIGNVNFGRLRPSIPIVCDFVDGGEWTGSEYESRYVASYESRYVASCDAVICVSRLLTQQARTLNASSFFIPNGVDLARYRAYRAAHTVRDCKLALGIDPDAFVISIIGMTCSSRLYFVDAAMALARSGRNVVLLLVGPSPLLPEIARRAEGADLIVRIEGLVPYEEIMPYFMATDVGLNVVDDAPYYHRQSPLKIFEYAAMGKPVVVAPWLDEIARNSLPNVSFCEPDAEQLAKHLSILADCGPPCVESDLSSYDWTLLAAQFEDVLAQVIARRRDTGGRRAPL